MISTEGTHIFTLTAAGWRSMIEGGAAVLHEHKTEVNDLNVFPIPDGDTGDNMFMTMRGGTNARTDSDELSFVSEQIAGGMLLGARGNSGVILSQFFAGIADGFSSLDEADSQQLADAFSRGVERAYRAVVKPTEGTILTVAREATEFAKECQEESIDGFLQDFIDEGRRSLKRTPELLDVLKDAGVIDSGGAGLLYIAEGMYQALTGTTPHLIEEDVSLPAAGIDPDLFTEDSVLEFGYCTELLVRLQRSKCDVENFDIEALIDDLKEIGESIVCLKTGSIVKLHIHTMTPDKVLSLCQRYGEFLSVKVENMMLQHNEIIRSGTEQPAKTEHVKYAVVAVAEGKGITEQFIQFGATEVIPGGQTKNPSAEDFINAFRRCNADFIFVLPNNGNILLAAKQAAAMFADADVRIIPTKSVGDGFAVMSMYDATPDSADEIEEAMKESCQGVVTVEISRCIRDSSMQGLDIRCGQYIALDGKNILSQGETAEEAAVSALPLMELDDHALLVILKGAGGTDEGSLAIKQAASVHPYLETVETDGGQDIYDYILIAE
ncbi:MAG: DAK2 domain-containing protein [Clostridia bacterium]|nr:DAK2 domain-containing protein [Clostridia bacterium]